MDICYVDSRYFTIDRMSTPMWSIQTPFVQLFAAILLVKIRKMKSSHDQEIPITLLRSHLTQNRNNDQDGVKDHSRNLEIAEVSGH